MLKRSRYKITYFVKSLLFLASWNSYRLMSQWNWGLICCVERYNRSQIQLFPHILNKIVCVRIVDSIPFLCHWMESKSIVKRAEKQVEKFILDNVRRLKFTILPYRKTNPPGRLLIFNIHVQSKENSRFDYFFINLPPALNIFCSVWIFVNKCALEHYSGVFCNQSMLSQRNYGHNLQTGTLSNTLLMKTIDWDVPGHL